MKKTSIKHRIAQLIEDQPLLAKSVVVTIFGDSIAPHGGSVWLGALIALLAPFGVSDRLVRTSVFRLAEEGWLDAQREGRRSAYTLTERGERRFERAYQRIYAPVDSHWDGGWTLVFGLQGTVDAMERSALRKELLWEGFCMMSQGVFAHPSFRVELLNEILLRTGVGEQVFACRMSELPDSAGRPMVDLIEYGWDLKPVIIGYRQFIDQFTPLSESLEKEDPVTAEQAFVIRTLLIHAFRRVQLHDPQLPVELLPPDWPGVAAYELCRNLYVLTYEAAEHYLAAVLQSETDTATTAAPYFFKRFGGLR